MIKPSLMLCGAIAAFILAGCTLGPDYQRPPNPPTAVGDFQNTSALAQQGAVSIEPALNGGWWRLYQDPRVDAFVKEALASNLELRTAANNLRASAMIVREAQSQQFPTTTLSNQDLYGKSQLQDSLYNAFSRDAPIEWTYTTAFSVSYEIDLFGRVRRNIEAAKADAETQRSLEDSVRLSVAARTIDAIGQICALGERIAVNDRAIAVSNQVRALVQSQTAAGEAAEFDLARQDVTTSSVAARRQPLEARRQALILELGQLLGRTPKQAPTELLACNTTLRVQHPIPVGDGLALLRRRPDVHAADEHLAAATARIGVAEADLYPRISLLGGVAETDNAQLAGANALSFGLGPAINWTFPNIVAARAKIGQSEAFADAARSQFDGAVLQALKEVEQSLSNYGHDLQQNQLLTRASRRADDAFRLAHQRYDSGDLSFLELLIAEQAKLEAQDSAAASDGQISGDQVAIFRALGGSWEHEDGPLDSSTAQTAPAADSDARKQP